MENSISKGYYLKSKLNKHFEDIKLRGVFSLKETKFQTYLQEANRDLLNKDQIVYFLYDPLPEKRTHVKLVCGFYCNSTNVIEWDDSETKFNLNMMGHDFRYIYCEREKPYFLKLNTKMVY